MAVSKALKLAVSTVNQWVEMLAVLMVVSMGVMMADHLVAKMGALMVEYLAARMVDVKENQWVALMAALMDG